MSNAGPAESLLIGLFFALRDPVRIPADWSAVVRSAVSYSRNADVHPREFGQIRDMTVEGFALAVLAERRKLAEGRGGDDGAQTGA